MLEAVRALLARNSTAENDLSLERQLLDDAARLAVLEESCKQEDPVSSGDAQKIVAELNSNKARMLAEALLANTSA